MQRKKRREAAFELDMTHGKLIPKVMVFALPLMLTSMLQLLYNAADVVVVGQFTGSAALAAVGSTGSLINLIVNVFLGLSVGTNVLVARDYGAGDRKGTYETVHTSILIGLIGGIVLGIFGYFMGGTFLKWMGSPKEVLPLATEYIQIYFIGLPFNMLYNFGAAILRAVGDTKRPLIFLFIAGMINVVLNLVFVIQFHMGVRGVAWATIISQFVSAMLVLICLMRSHGFIHLDIRRLHINMKKLGVMLKIGLPAGFQGACFSISNVLIQSTVNANGAIVVAGNSASSNIEGFIYAAMNAFHQAAISFVSTNIGAGKYSRIKKSMGACLSLVMIVGVVMGALVCLLRTPLLSIYSNDEAVIQAGLRRLLIIASTYSICGLMDVLCGVMRGMGASLVPMLVSILGVCAFRIFWIYVILPIVPSLEMLYISYPVSWIITGVVHFICCMALIRRYPADVPEPSAAAGA